MLYAITCLKITYIVHLDKEIFKTRRVLKKDKALGRRWCELVIELIWGIRNGEVYI